MERQKHWNILTLIISMLLVCALSFTAFAEDAASGAEKETEPEGTDVYTELPDEIIGHRLWGFFTGWAQGDTARVLDLCSSVWKRNKKDPEQALRGILPAGRPRGYKINDVSGEDGDPVRTASVTLQWETDAGYEYIMYGVACVPDADGFYAVVPDGLGLGMPVEQVPEEELVLLTQEEIIRNSLEMHGAEGEYDKMVPINAADEKRGIRMEVVSGYAQGKDACFLISLQDTEGQFEAYELEPSFADNVDGSYSRSWSRVYHDDLEHRDLYVVHQQLDMEVQPADRSVPVGVSEIWIRENKTVGLIPLLQQYGETTEGVRPPALDTHYSPDEAAVPENAKVLEHGKPLDIPLSGDVCLSGIGWISGQLHVQFHNRGKTFVELRNGRGTACSAWAGAAVYGKTYNEINVDYSPLYWEDSSDGWPEWSEFIFNCGPEDADKLDLEAEISVTADVLEDGWSVQIPLNRICAAAGPEEDAPVPDSTAGTAYTAAYPSIMEDEHLYTLWEFFCRWAQADTDELRYSLTEDQRYGQGTEELIRALLAGGTPLDYQINHVEWTGGDAPRKYTCTVLVDPGSGEEPRYRQYEIGMKAGRWGSCIDLGSLACLGDAERDPAAATVSLAAEAVINDHMDYFNPGIREQLRPVGLYCEMTGGIRMELISGLVKDNEAWFIYSLQEPDGKNDDYQYSVFSAYDDIGTLNTFSTSMIYHDRKEHKAYMLWNPRYKDPVGTADRDVTLSVDHVDMMRNIWTDLVPFLKQYGEAAESMQAPADTRDSNGNTPNDLKDMKVLDRSSQPDISLLGNTTLAGIGWIDGKLHVQIRMSEPISWSMDVDDSPRKGYADGKEVSGSPFEWYDTDGMVMEYVFDCQPQDLENLNLRLSGQVGQGRENGPWEIKFPLSMILPKAPGAGEIGYDPEAGGCVYTLGGIRYLLNGDGTATVLVDGGNTDGATVPETIVFTVNGQ